MLSSYECLFLYVLYLETLNIFDRYCSYPEMLRPVLRSEKFVYLNAIYSSTEERFMQR